MAFELVLTEKVADVLSTLSRDRRKYQKAVRWLEKLEENPGHRGLSSHRYQQISGPLGEPIWESYVENHTPSAWRVWWFYGPDDGQITVIALGPHP